VQRKYVGAGLIDLEVGGGVGWGGGGELQHTVDITDPTKRSDYGGSRLARVWVESPHA
jgi:hypothetical protein